MKRSAFLLVALLSGCVSAIDPKPSPLGRLSASWTSSAESVEMPLGVITSEGRLRDIVVMLPFLGKEEAFVVDTGAPSSWLSQEFCRMKGLVPGHKIKTAGIGGAAAIFQIVAIPEVDLGFAVLRDWHLSTGTIPRVENDNPRWIAAGKPPMVGLLGADVLHAFGAAIDYSKMTITFKKKPNKAPEPTP